MNLEELMLNIGMLSSLSDHTIYVSSLMVDRKGVVSKHYYNGTQRVLSKLGSGTFRNSYTSSNRTLTAGNKNYLARQMQLESGLREYYQTLQQPPGNPLGKSVSAQPEQTSAPLPTVVGNYDIPKGWPRTPVQSPSGGPPGAPVQLGSVQSNDSVRAGYGYVDDGKVENDRYFYHPDHLGSTTVITQKDGIGVEYLSYMPFGETLVEEHSTDVDLPYKFSGKEQDQETGLLYFGARYYDPKLKFWLGVDPLAEKYPDVGGYVYCHNNPVNAVDPDGKGDYYTNKGVYLGQDKNINDNMVYSAGSRNEDGSFKNAIHLSGTHVEFQKSSNVVKQESQSADGNEDLWIAHTANNNAKESNTTLYKKLMSTYSSVGDKSPLGTSDNTSDAQRARSAVIDVLSGGLDPTCGSKFWDGTDFLAWGLKSPNGTPHNKFEEYSNINISKDVYSSYLKAQQGKYGSSVRYGASGKFNIPAGVFLNKDNWINGSFNFKTGKKGKSLISTGSFGGSIFWKTK
jgi:RHS repeat-associated protein